jgi:hypothetical protein
VFYVSSLSCNNVRFSQGHVLDVLGFTDDWYWGCNMMLSFVIANGERGERWENPHTVAACRDQVEVEVRRRERSPRTEHKKN